MASLHGSGPRQGNNVIGGLVYRGPIEALNGHYLFADFIDGKSIPIAQVSPGATLGSDRFVLHRADFTPTTGAITMPVCFALDQAGNFYLVDLGGSIFRIDAG